MSSIDLFQKCADIQRDLFYRNFMANNKVGEITCVNAHETEDSYLFERFEVNGVGFIVPFRLVCEDSCIMENRYYEQKTVQELVSLKNTEQKQRYADFMKKLEKENKTLAQVADEIEKAGGDPRSVDYKEFTRDMLEDSLHPGRRRINGDRNSRIQIMYRQQDIPNDLQKSAVETFELPMPAEVLDFITILDGKEREEWMETHLTPTLKEVELGCHLPFFHKVTNVIPIIYRFPEREVDVEKAVGYN